MAYKNIEAKDWTPENEGDFVEGILLKSKPEVGPNKSMLYNIKADDGQIWNVWGSTILDEKMAQIEINEKVKITYQGKSKDAAKGKQPAKLFQVQVDRD